MWVALIALCFILSPILLVIIFLMLSVTILVMFLDALIRMFTGKD